MGDHYSDIIDDLYYRDEYIKNRIAGQEKKKLDQIIRFKMLDRMKDDYGFGNKDWAQTEIEKEIARDLNHAFDLLQLVLEIN